MKSLFKLLLALAILVGIGIYGFRFYNNYFSESTGEMVEKSVEVVGHFDELRLDGVLNFYLKQGKKEELYIDADEEIIDDIDIEHNGNKFSVELKKRGSFRKSIKADVYITVVDLKKLRINGIGNVSIENLEVDDLEMEVAGVGNKSFDLYCNNLQADISSVGNVTFTGKAKEVEMNNSSVGNLTADEFKTKRLRLKNKGAGNVRVHADKEISIRSSGVGNIKYSGGAEVKEMEINGIGKVKKI